MTSRTSSSGSFTPNVSGSISRWRSVEIGYWLREEQQGKGIMAAAVRTLCDLAFGEMGMRRVEIRCGTGNLPSNRIPQRLGFLRSHVEAQGEQLSDGEWIDLNVYVLER